MLKSLSNFLNLGRLDEGGSANKSNTPHSDHEIELAAAVLLLEAAMMEGGLADNERQTIETLLKSRFDLSADELRDLVDLAVQKQQDAVEIHRFTNTLKQNFSEEERIDILEMIWEVAYADGELHDYEAHLIRRVGGLIHVSDRDRGEARKRVLDRLGLSRD